MMVPMSIDPTQQFTITLGAPMVDDVQKRDDVKFRTMIDQTIKEAEMLRMSYMHKLKTRKYIATTLSIIFVLCGALAFGYFFLMYGLILLATGCLLFSFFPPYLIEFWANGPARRYKKIYKDTFLPKLAKTLGGLSYFKTRGVSEKIIRKTGVLPAFDIYRAEDCFMGKYKGVKVIFSEARLYKRQKNRKVFDGVFVLMELPSDVIEGHTIITADMKAARSWETSRWKKLSQVNIPLSDEHANRFSIYADTPEFAHLIVGERLLKELAEAAIVFKDAALSTVLFRKKYIFMAIPYDGDMFEPSDIAEPVATQEHIDDMKTEIDKLLEIIDVFELYDSHINLDKIADNVKKEHNRDAKSE
jgi:hypothetical protein